MVLCMLLSTRDVFTFCGNNEQTDELKTTLTLHASTYTALTSLSAIPVTSAALTLLQVMTSMKFGSHLQNVFTEMKETLNKDHMDYQKCSEILEKTITTSAVISTAYVGLSVAALIPGVNLALIPPRMGSSLAAILLIRDCLNNWDKQNCQYATARDCDL